MHHISDPILLKKEEEEEVVVVVVVEEEEEEEEEEVGGEGGGEGGGGEEDDFINIITDNITVDNDITTDDEGNKNDNQQIKGGWGLVERNGDEATNDANDHIEQKMTINK